MYCTNCGQHATGRFCAHCGAPTPSGSTPQTFAPDTTPSATTAGASAFDTTIVEHPQLHDDPSLEGLRLWLAAGGTALSFALTLAALFPNFWAHGPSLADNNSSLAYNVPFLAVGALAALLLVVRRFRLVGLGVLVGGVVVAAPAYLRNLGDVAGDAEAGAGFVLGQLGFLVLLLSAAVALFAARGRGLFRVTLGTATAKWAAAGAALGAGFAIGDVMNWRRVDYHATTAGYTYLKTGTAFLHVDCCTLLDHHGWSLWTEVLLLALAVLTPLVAALLLRKTVCLGLLVATGMLLLASPLSSVVQLATTITPDSIGIDPTTVTQSGLVLSQRGLPGLWLAFGAALGLLALAALRALSGSAHRAEA